MPADLLAAIEDGEINQAQVRQLIAIEAEAIGLSFDEAIAGVHADTLPQNPIGLDIRLLSMMLVDEADEAGVDNA
jgi:hypothetical protein